MKTFLLTSLFTFSISVPSFALLSPLHQSVKEFQELLNSPYLTKNLASGEMITDVAKDHDEFIVSTNKSTMIVKIIYESQKMPGPAKFRFEFEPAKAVDSDH